MFQSKLTDLLEIEMPIIGGTMMDISTAPFVAAISEAGALGLIASAIYKDEDRFRADLKAVKDGTDRPFGVNVNLFPMMRKLDNLRYLDIMAEEGVKIVETSGFSPPLDVVERIREHEMIWLHKCVGVRYGLKAQSLGARAVTVVGYQNGGATGKLNIATMVLVPATVDALDIPVVAGGGIMDGRTLLAALALGASGVIVGTRIMLSEECPIHQNLKDAMLEATELDTDVVMASVGFAHRLWLNEPAKKVVEIEARNGEFSEIYPYVSGEAAKKMIETGDLDAGTISCSQGIGLVHDIKPLRQIFEEMMADAERIHGALAM